MGKKKKKWNPDDDPFLPMPLPEKPEIELKVNPPKKPIWTENKAKLIERYLLYFVYITKHGTYIDGFAGPQEPDLPEMWSAKLVLENEPKWLRNFHLFDINKSKVKQLNKLKDEQPVRDSKGRKINRKINVYSGDFNEQICKLLESKSIRQKDATFCLLDQHTFECEWTTVEKIARYKKDNLNKIELFYFLAVGWLNRAFSNTTRNLWKIEKWWGRDDYLQLKPMTPFKQMEMFVDRFKNELGYKSVIPWSIYERKNGGKIMYYMIHATDHPKAPTQMARAYNNAVKPKESSEQLNFMFGEESAADK